MTANQIYFSMEDLWQPIAETGNPRDGIYLASGRIISSGQTTVTPACIDRDGWTSLEGQALEVDAWMPYPGPYEEGEDDGEAAGPDDQ